jgi:hypothetical protein
MTGKFRQEFHPVKAEAFYFLRGKLRCKMPALKVDKFRQPRKYTGGRRK